MVVRAGKGNKQHVVPIGERVEYSPSRLGATRTPSHCANPVKTEAHCTAVRVTAQYV